MIVSLKTNKLNSFLLLQLNGVFGSMGSEMGHKLHYETKLLYQSFCFVKGIEAKLRNSKEDKFILHTFPSKENHTV